MTAGVRIGVLALQGDFAMHAQALERCGAETIEVRKPEQLADVDGLVIPGGESTTLLKLMDAWGFVPALEQYHAEGKPIFGTCAGLILLARDVQNPRQFSLGLIDVGVERNAYGRQRESFEARGVATLDGRRTPIEMVFIRAPRIYRLGPGVQTLAEHRGETVMAREGTVLVATFHPELTDDPTVHRYFCEMVLRAQDVAVRGEPRSGGEPSGEMGRTMVRGEPRSGGEPSGEMAVIHSHHVAGAPARTP